MKQECYKQKCSHSLPLSLLDHWIFLPLSFSQLLTDAAVRQSSPALLFSPESCSLLLVLRAFFKAERPISNISKFLSVRHSLADFAVCSCCHSCLACFIYNSRLDRDGGCYSRHASMNPFPQVCRCTLCSEVVVIFIILFISF